MSNRRFAAFILGFAMTGIACAKEPVNFMSRPHTAGKALLSGHGYIFSITPGVANFSPELRFPIQIFYASTNRKTGMFGYGWSSPQLESTAVPQRDGVIWTTPWGEAIRFYAKNKIDKASLQLLGEPSGGNAFFSPYADWNASTPATGNKFAESGDWTFSGKDDYAGWVFTYRNARLLKIVSAAGNEIVFAYDAGGRPVSISQNGTAFVELSYAERTVASIAVNGITHTLSYKNGAVSVPPKDEKSPVTKIERPLLASVSVGNLAPIEFAYDAHGYLVETKQGDFVDAFTVQHGVFREFPPETDDKTKAQILGGEVAGRILSDNVFTYSYSGRDTGKIRLENKKGQTASYNMDGKTGVFKITEFSGKAYTIYYFMRYDVAYLGKVRQIEDAKKRTVVSYRYDKKSGKPTRKRDMAGNDILMKYDAKGNLAELSRRGARDSHPAPVSRMTYDERGNPTALIVLDEKAQPVVTTRIKYDASDRPVSIDNGRQTVTVTYNRFGYPASVKNAFGQTSQIEYDKYNRPVASANPYGVQSITTRTPEGLVAKMERKDGALLLSSVAIDYNRTGQPVKYVDHRGRVKQFERDEFGRVVKEFLPDDTSIEYDYDTTGRLTKVLDQNRNPIQFNWDRFGIGSRTTAANQLTDYVYDDFGLLNRIDSSKDGDVDRSIAYEYDEFDRVKKITYADNEVETFKYDTWGRILETTRGTRKAAFEYDFFGRLVRSTEGTLVNRYKYNAYGQRIARLTIDGDFRQEEERTYDAYGRLKGIRSDKDFTAYHYNDRNQILVQIVNDTYIRHEYTKYGQLKKKTMDAGVPEIEKPVLPPKELDISDDLREELGL